MQRAFHHFFSTLSLLCCLIPLAVKAQVTPDGKTSTTVDRNGNDFVINEGDRVGDNLFHSFDEFSVPTGGSAGFSNAADIANIFSRVTGGNISNIDGLLSADGAANLYLINPNGIIFGENTRLDLGGSFFASTADSLLFEGDTEFSAVNPQASPLLEVNIPIGATFRDNPGNIAVNGSLLEVSNGETISLVGGNVNIAGLANGSIFAIDGRVNLASATGGEIAIADDAINLPNTTARGDVSLNNFAFISVAGNRGGEIKIDARNISFTGGEFGASEMSAGIVEAGAEDAIGGDIILNATDTVSLVEGNIFNQVLTGSQGEGGAVIINANNFVLEDGSISANLFGAGSTGKVTINATDNVTLNRFGSISSGVGETGVGNSGGVEINSNSLTISDRSFIGSQLAGEGNAGGITIATGEFQFGDRSEISTQVLAPGIGNGATIKISATNFSLDLFSNIDSSTVGNGNAGNIAIDVTDTVEFTRGSRIFSQTDATATGNGGNITINAPNLTIGGGSAILADTVGVGNGGNIEINSNNFDLISNGSLSTESVSEGQAGNITINTAILNIEADPERSPPGITTVAFVSGDGGDIEINATDEIAIDSGIISSQAANFEELNVIDGEGQIEFIRGTGNGGNININTNNLSLTNGASIDATTFSTGNAGNIAIEATENLSLSDSIIDSSVANIGLGNAGTIQIDTSNLALVDSTINAVTSGSGDAANIAIAARDNIAIDNSNIANVATASSLGNAGNIELSTQDLQVENAQINTSNLGEGNGGNIFLTADNVSLNNGNISAANTPVETSENLAITGGEIDFQSGLLSLDNNSLISAEAGNNASGGNLNLNSDIIVAFPGNNDIVANAEAGRGGNININTEAIFGIQERAINPFTNDINASSEFGLQGNIAINTPEIDPTSGLIELPEAVGDESDRISQNPCQQGVGSEFIITGKGGLPPSVDEAINSEPTQVGLIEPLPYKERGANEEIDREINVATPAQGWVFNHKGEVTLTAYSTSLERVKRSHQQDLSTCSNKRTN